MEIFVFGSNLQGIHGKGAALHAKNHYGAIQGKGRGIHYRSYAIPTKMTPYIRLSLIEINFYVAEFICYAKGHDDYTFLVTAIGCGLAGHKPEQIAPMFFLAKDLPNVQLPQEFIAVLQGNNNV